MIKVYIPDLHLHRNETTFRPFLPYFNEMGLTLTERSFNADMVWVGHASYMNKKIDFNKSISSGVKFLESIKNKNIYLFDGQDSGTLKGSIELSNVPGVVKIFKNSLYNYNLPSVNGRIFWPDASGYTSTVNEKIFLSGTNWLSTVAYSEPFPETDKPIDIFAMFQYPGKINYEWNERIDYYYTEHRKKCINELNRLESKYNIVTVCNTGYVDYNTYINTMRMSKVVIAPFGYGEIAPRDIESAICGCSLVKPKMDHVHTYPNIYINNKTYIGCEWDYTDLHSAIDTAITHRRTLSNNMLTEFKNKYTPASQMTFFVNQLLMSNPNLCIDVN